MEVYIEPNSKETFKAHLMLRPPLKWAGGKRWLVPHLVQMWQENRSRRFAEPFCGGLSIPLALQPERALLNDINPHLINFYSQLKRGLPLTVEMRNDEKLFYEHRMRFNELINRGEWKTAESAQLFYYLNRTGFNGLCRFNQRGEFNVPFGRHTSIHTTAIFRRSGKFSNGGNS